MSILIAASIGLTLVAVALIIVTCRVIGALNRLRDAIGKLNLNSENKTGSGVKFMGPTTLPFGKSPISKSHKKQKGKFRKKHKDGPYASNADFSQAKDWGIR